MGKVRGPKPSGEEFDNDPALEKLWAIKAADHMNIYFNLITSVDPRMLRLTPQDEEIYTNFRSQFPTFDVHKLDQDEMKSKEGKEKWREFCMSFEGKVADFSHATLTRVDSALDYSQENTFVTPRIQFLAIEVARNREGHNDQLREVYGKKIQEEKEKREELEKKLNGNNNEVNTEDVKS